MIKLRDSIVYCAACGAENFYCADEMKANGGQSGQCWSCKKQLQLPARIRIGNSIVMLNHDVQIFPHHIDDSRLYDFTKQIAAMVQHPQNPNVWGIKNLSNEKWVVTTTEGAVNDVEPGRSVSLAVGTRINFGKVEGEIRV